MVQFPDIISTWYFPFVYYSQSLQFWNDIVIVTDLSGMMEDI